MLVTWVCAQEAPVPTHLKVKATFTRTGKDGKPEVLAQPSVITVDGKPQDNAGRSRVRVIMAPRTAASEPASAPPLRPSPRVQPGGAR